MKKKAKIRKLVLWTAGLSFLFILVFSYFYIRGQVPERIHVVLGEEGSFRFSLPWGSTVETENEEVVLSGASNIPEGAVRISGGQGFTVEGTAAGSYDMDFKLFGWLPLRSVDVEVVEPESVIPGGEPVGIYLETDGIMVAGTGKITDDEGNTLEPARGVLESGDYILEAGGEAVSCKEELIEKLNEAGEGSCTLTVRRNGQVLEKDVETVRCDDGSVKAGIWVRDDAQGIGTLTYVDTDGRFGALGHAMSDSDTGMRLEVSGGSLEHASIRDVVRGKDGTPGSLLGTIVYGGSRMGTVEKNTEAGIFGQIAEGEPDWSAAVPVGYMQDVETGPASIRCCADGQIKEYDIEILTADIATDSYKGLVLQVTDPELLSLTGGIVQGMSGSPIIQNGKLVGAVTHVFIRDSTKGYGIFLEKMLEQSY